MLFRNWTRLLALSCFLPLLLLADQVTLKNGDRVTGQIVKKDGDKLTVKSELMGEVSIPWSAVTSITSSEPLVVVLPGGKSVTGTLSTSDGKLQVATPSGTETAPLADVSAVRNCGRAEAVGAVAAPRPARALGRLRGSRAVTGSRERRDHHVRHHLQRRTRHADRQDHAAV